MASGVQNLPDFCGSSTIRKCPRCCVPVCTAHRSAACRKYSLYETTAEDWTAILDLAHRWSFPEVKSLAVRELEKLELPDIDRIVTYHKYDVDRTLLIPRYAALVQREQPLSLPEGMRLGMETTLTIARARECARASPSAAGGLRSPSPTNIGREEMFGIVKDIFGITPEVDEPAAAATASGSSPTTQKDPVVTQTKPTATPPGKFGGTHDLHAGLIFNSIAAVATASAAPAAAPIATPVITPVTTKTEPSANTNGAPVGAPLTQTTSNGDGTVTPSLDADGSDVDPLIRVDSPISRGGRPSGARRGTRGGRP